MRKKAGIVLLTAAMTVGAGITSFAGSWQKDSAGWWWQNDDGGYPAGTWEWIDGNGDGAEECYYFDNMGYCLQNTQTPDGYMVNGDGAWVVEGVAQTRAVEKAEEAEETVYSDDYSGTYVVPFYESENNLSYHTITLTYDKGFNTIVYDDPAAGYRETFTFLGTGLNGWTCFELETEYEKNAVFFSAPGVLEAYAWDGYQSVGRN